jgi:hypothetical protein
MDGFVVAERNEETGDIIGFWDGTVLQEEQGSATLFTTKDDARFRFGQVQAQYPMKEITILEARQTIELVTPTRTAAR